MAATVRDLMNPQLVYLAAGTRPEAATQPILDFGITAVPVLDEDRRPIGMVSLRDLIHTSGARPPMTENVVSVGVDESLRAAAQKLADAGLHHVVVVDAEGRAVGMLSAVDVVRGLLGLGSRHPPAIEAFGRPVGIKAASARQA
jgi:CBS-domain-containing membrane protein